MLAIHNQLHVLRFNWKYLEASNDKELIESHKAVEVQGEIDEIKLLNAFNFIAIRCFGTQQVQTVLIDQEHAPKKPLKLDDVFFPLSLFLALISSLEFLVQREGFLIITALI